MGCHCCQPAPWFENSVPDKCNSTGMKILSREKARLLKINEGDVFITLQVNCKSAALLRVRAGLGGLLGTLLCNTSSCALRQGFVLSPRLL